MSIENGGYSPKEIKKIEKQREKSDIELMKDGAELDENTGELILTKDQKRAAYEEMEREISQKSDEDNRSWIRKNSFLIAPALTAIGVLPTASVETLSEALRNVPLIIGNTVLTSDSMYALLTLQHCAAGAGAVVSVVALIDAISANRQRAIEEGDLKKKLKTARKLQNSRE